MTVCSGMRSRRRTLKRTAITACAGCERTCRICGQSPAEIRNDAAPGDAKPPDELALIAFSGSQADEFAYALKVTAAFSNAAEVLKNPTDSRQRSGA